MAGFRHLLDPLPRSLILPIGSWQSLQKLAIWEIGVAAKKTIRVLMGLICFDICGGGILYFPDGEYIFGWSFFAFLLSLLT